MFLESVNLNILMRKMGVIGDTDSSDTLTIIFLSFFTIFVQMFTLLSGLWKYLFQKDEFFVVILGLDNAGKTVSW